MSDKPQKARRPRYKKNGPMSPAEKAEALPRALDALESLDVSILDYDEWTHVGMGLCDADSSEATFSAWDKWSSQDSSKDKKGNPRYKPEEMRDKWDSYKGMGIEVDAVFALCRKYGIPFVGPSGDLVLSMDNRKNSAFLNDGSDEEGGEPERTPIEELRDATKILFQPGDVININPTFKGWGLDFTYEELLRRCEEAQERGETEIDGVVGEYDHEAGLFWRVNPVSGEHRAGAYGYTDKDITDARWLVVEADYASKVAQGFTFDLLSIPAAIFVDTGNKSIHALVKQDAKTAKGREANYALIKAACDSLSLDLDTSCSNANRYSRVPGALRGEKRQHILKSDEEADWAVWVRRVIAPLVAREQDYPEKKVSRLRLSEQLLQDKAFRKAVRCDTITQRLWQVTALPGATFTEPQRIEVKSPMDHRIWKYVAYKYGDGITYAAYSDAMGLYSADCDGYDAVSERLHEAVPMVQAWGGSIRESWDNGKTWTEGKSWRGNLVLSYLMDPAVPHEKPEYVRAVEETFLCGIVGRIIYPGCTYQLMPILCGPQGCGKSTFVCRLSMPRSTHHHPMFLGEMPDWKTEGVRAIQSALIVEVAELSTFINSENSEVKGFISRNMDLLNPKYKDEHQTPRRAVFFGTTNDPEILSDPTGNRRYPIVHCSRKENDADPRMFGWVNEKPAGCPCATELDHDILIAYAETMMLHASLGKDRFFDMLELPHEFRAEMEEVQAGHMTEDPVYQDVFNWLMEEKNHIGERVCASMFVKEVMTDQSDTFRRDKGLQSAVMNAFKRCEREGHIAKLHGRKQFSVPGCGMQTNAWERCVGPIEALEG